MKTLTALTAILGISISLTISAHADLIAEADPLIINNDQNKERINFELHATNTSEGTTISLYALSGSDPTCIQTSIDNRPDFMDMPLKKGQRFSIKGSTTTGDQGVTERKIILANSEEQPLQTFTIKIINKGLPTFSTTRVVWPDETDNSEKTITITKEGWNLKDTRSLLGMFSVKTSEDEESIKLQIQPIKAGIDKIRVILSKPNNPDRIYHIQAGKK